MTSGPQPSPTAGFLGPQVAVIGFFVLSAAFGLNFAAGQFFEPLHRDKGWSLTTLSAIAAVNTALAGLVQPFAGRLIDRIGARPVIGSAIALLGLSWLGMAAAQELWQWGVLYAGAAAVGFGAASSMPVSVLIAHWYQRRRSIVLPRVFLGINIGQLTLLPLAGVLITVAGWRTSYLVLGLVVAVIIAPLALLGLHSRPADVGQLADGARIPPDAPPPAATLREALRSRDWWLLTAAFAINGATLYLVLLHLPRLAVDVGGSLGVGGGLIAVAAGASVLSMLLQSRSAASVDRRALIVGLFAVRAGAMLGATVATGVGSLFVFAAVFGLASFSVIPLITGSIADRYGTNAMGAALGITFVAHQAGAGIGVLLAGLTRASTGSYDLALVVGVALLGAGAAFVVAVSPSSPARPASLSITNPKGSTA